MTSSFLSVVFLAVLATSSRVISGDVTCPVECRCGVVSGAPSADCSGRRISDLSSVVERLHPNTQVLDLRSNELTVVHANAFSSVRNLSVILLDDNHIHRVEPHAFRGLSVVRLLSLTGNRITTVAGNSFSDLSGRKEVCAALIDGADNGKSGTQNVDERQSSCIIDLSRNDVRSVERHAFAWNKYLDVVLGDGRLPLSVDAYAFYGARWMRRVVFQSVPMLTLHPRIFTNTESVDAVVIRNTQMTKMDRFVFEGLKDVGGIVLDRVDIDNVHSFAFSGIHFRPCGPSPTSDLKTGGTEMPVNGSNALFNSEPSQTSRQARNAKRRSRYALSGGLLNLTSCHVGVLSTDAFRDANLAHILFSRTDVDHLEKHAFRGVSGLQSLRLVDCRLGSSLGGDVFSSLRGLSQLHLAGLVNTQVVDTFAFRGTTDVDELVIHFRSDKVTLRTEAFAHLSDVGTLELRGSQFGTGNTDSQSSTTALSIGAGAFRNLFGVERLRIDNFRLPTLRRHSFSGLSRVGNLTISDCSVSGIEHEAFGDVAAHVGAIGLLDLGVGNQLRCNCGTTSSVAALQRQLAQRFSDYRAVCRVESEGTGQVSYVDIRQMASTPCNSGSSRWTVLSTSSILSVIAGLAVYR